MAVGLQVFVNLLLCYSSIYICHINEQEGRTGDAMDLHLISDSKIVIPNKCYSI